MKRVRMTPLTLGRVGLAVAGFLLFVTSIAALEIPRADAATSCRARNVTWGSAAVADLQAAIRAARPGDKIVITGTCVGNYTVGKSLTFEGQPTTAMPTPTLDGDETGSVIKVKAGTVRFKKLTIQNGYAKDGGGIHSAGGYSAAGVYYPGGHIILNSTTVRGNTAAGGGEWASNNGGGIAIGSYEASLTLNVGSRVVHNIAVSQDEAYGGGIYTDGGSVTLNGNALVADNYTNGLGGGIAGAEGNIHLKGTSSVRRNVGGGIYSDVGQITMSGSSLVASNDDGGVYGWDSLLLSGSASVINNTGGGVNIYTEACDASSPSPWIGAISPNTPDEVPQVTYIRC